MKEIMEPFGTFPEASAPEKERALMREYFEGIKEYDKTYGELKKADGHASGEEARQHARFLDNELREMHARILRVAKSLGKNKDEVCADIIRERGTLEQYGLPEFSVLLGDELERPHCNVDMETMLPRDSAGGDVHRCQAEKRASDELARGLKRMPGSKYYQWHTKMKNSAAIIYEAAPIFRGKDVRDEEGLPMVLRDHVVRRHRAMAFAEDFGAEFFEKDDRQWHPAEVKITGVLVPKEQLEKAAMSIVAHAERFRIGEQFYSEQEKKEARVAFREMTRRAALHISLSQKDKQRYLAEQERVYGER